MDNRPLGGVLDGAAEDFMGEWGGISLPPQEDKPHYVCNEIDVAPVEVDVGNAARGPLFWCEDVFATAKALQSNGVEITAEPRKEVWATMAKFKDPDGNEFVFSSK
jgi:predicted enzyme related to lactoylglutathione lyase